MRDGSWREVEAIVVTGVEELRDANSSRAAAVQRWQPGQQKLMCNSCNRFREISLVHLGWRKHFSWMINILVVCLGVSVHHFQEGPLTFHNSLNTHISRLCHSCIEKKSQ
jgi:hypothetical protein